MFMDRRLIHVATAACLCLVVHVSAFDGGGQRRLQSTYLTPGSTNQTYPNATLSVSAPINETECGSWYQAPVSTTGAPEQCPQDCILSGFNGIPNATVTGPLVINVTAGEVARLDLQTPAGTYLVLTGIRDAPYYKDLLAPADAKTGIMYFRFSANSTAPGDSVSLAAGLAQAPVAGVVNRLAPLEAPAVPLCLLNVTFSVVNASDAPRPAPYCPTLQMEGNVGFCNNGGNNTGNYNTGYNNRGSYNVGNNNTGNFNMGTGNVGNCNKGSFNKGNGIVGDFKSGDFPCPEGTPGAQGGPSIVPGSVAAGG